MLNNIKLFILTVIESLTFIDWAIISAVIISLFIVLYRKGKKAKIIINNGIVLAESYFNSGEGQKKLDYAVEYIVAFLPVILRGKYISKIVKFFIVSVIELILKFVSNVYDLNYTVDIIGNDETLSPSVAKIKDIEVDTKIDEINKEIKLEIKKGKEFITPKTPSVENVDNNSGTQVYGKVTAETDFHDNPTIKAEVGVIKKI